MKLLNMSKRTYMHSVKNEEGKDVYITLEPRATKEIPDKIAKIWVAGGEVVEVADESAKDKEIAELKAENEKLKATKKKVAKKK